MDTRLIPARYYARLCELLAHEGVDTRRLLETAGIDPDGIREPDASLSLQRVEAFVGAVVRLTRRSDLSHDLGRALKLTSHSLVGYGMLSSPTVDYALRLLSRFFGLIMPAFRLRYRAGRDDTEIAVHPVWPMSQGCMAFHLEVIAVAVHWELRELLQKQMPPYALYLSIAEPPHAARYAEMVEMRPYFDWHARPGLSMHLPAEIATRPLALADPAALKLAEQRCSAMLRSVRATGKVSEWVEMVLREASDGIPSQTELARTLNLSPRTLDRYLKKEGASFRSLSKRARQDKAHSLLVEGQLSVTQIAYELGYTDVSNFARAFRRENGLSPSEWRERHAESGRRAPRVE